MEKLLNALESVKRQVETVPKIGIVLGSGWGEFASRIKVKATIPYNTIKGFPTSTVEGHRGRFVFGTVGGVEVVVMQGRVHYYEGYSVQDVVMPVRLMALMGINALILTNAAGGINKGFKCGTLMAITDHIMLNVPNPLIGANLPQLGQRFPDMTYCYDRRLTQAVICSAEKIGVPISQGVYFMTSGPSFETPAEIRTMAVMGADAVGMSTAIEAIAARHMNVSVCGISCITNMAAGLSGSIITADEVNQTAEQVQDSFCSLLTQSITTIARLP